MAFFDADKAGVLWDAVALPNAFICEYMPSAPEGYVKVYLYGLMYARFPAAAEGVTPETLARELDMGADEVESAFQYWERCRLVARTQDKPPKYAYLNIQQAMMERRDAPVNEKDVQFTQAIYAVFGNRRAVHGGELGLCFEWVEQLRLPREVVLMMLQHLIDTRGVNFSFKTAQKFAVELVEHQIVSIEAAEQFFARSLAAWTGTKSALRRISIYREPTVDEIDLYLKWTAEWGFTPKAVESACREMKGIRDPNFKYLDKILENAHGQSDRKETTAEQLDRHLAQKEDEAALIREVLQTTGINASAYQNVVQEVYRHMRSLLPHGTILLAAREISRTKQSRSLDKLESLVEAWSGKGLRTPEDVENYLSQVKEQNAFLRELFTLMRWGKITAPKDRELLAKWRGEWGFTDDLLRTAAEFAAGMNAPMAFLDKLLAGYRADGVTTAEAARADHEKHLEKYRQTGAAPKPGKTVIEQRYGQREYDPAEVDGFTPEEIEEVRRYHT